MVHKADMTQGELARIAGERIACQGVEPAACSTKERQPTGRLSAFVLCGVGGGSRGAQAGEDGGLPARESWLSARRAPEAGRAPDSPARSAPARMETVHASHARVAQTARNRGECSATQGGPQESRVTRGPRPQEPFCGCPRSSTLDLSVQVRSPHGLACLLAGILE